MDCLGEDDEGGEARGGLPDEAGVGGEPGDVALVAAVEEDGSARASPPAAAAHQVPLSASSSPTPGKLKWSSRCWKYRVSYS
jgi:hypothetical protein